MISAQARKESCSSMHLDRLLRVEIRLQGGAVGEAHAEEEHRRDLVVCGWGEVQV